LLHSLHKRDDVLGADDVRPQSALQRRIERHVTRRVDYDIDVAGNSLGLFLSEAEIIFSNVTADDGDFVANEFVKSRAVSVAHWIERLRADHVIPKARLGLFLRPSSHRHVHATDVREPVQQHAERNFAEEPGAAYQKYLATVENLSR